MKPIKLISIWKPKPKQKKLWAIYRPKPEVTEQDVLNSINRILKLIDNGKR